jgi:lipopolysaccharide heptosyltransferase II
VNWLGDVLFSTPAIRAVRKKHPGAYIAALVVPRCKEILLGNNYLDEIIILDEGNRHKGLKGKLKLVKDLRLRRFTCAYLLRPSLTRTFCIFLAGIKKRIGFGRKKGDFFLTEKIKLPLGDFHRADNYYYLVTGMPIPEGERYYDFFVSSEDRAYINDFLKKNNLEADRGFAVLHVGGNWDLKLWPKENFAFLVDRLREDYRVNVIISGGVKEYALAHEIAALAKHKPFIACGLTTLKQLGVLFQKSDCVISGDSGPLHVAVAMEAKTVSLFGPTSPEITGPFGRGDFSILRNKNIPCVIPCYNLQCRDNICMRSITVESVLEEVEKRGWLKKTEGRKDEG